MNVLLLHVLLTEVVFEYDWERPQRGAKFDKKDPFEEFPLAYDKVEERGSDFGRIPVSCESFLDWLDVEVPSSKISFFELSFCVNFWRFVFHCEVMQAWRQDKRYDNHQSKNENE